MIFNTSIGFMDSYVTNKAERKDICKINLQKAKFYGSSNSAMVPLNKLAQLSIPSISTREHFSVNISAFLNVCLRF